MGKTGRTLLLGISVLFLLSTIFMACGSSEESNNVTIPRSPIERLQDLELGLSTVQTNMDKAEMDFTVIQSIVDYIREDLDILASEVTNLMNYTCPITLDMYNEVTTNISVLQGVSYFLSQRIEALEAIVEGNGS